MRRFKVFAEVKSYSILPPGVCLEANISSDCENIIVRVKNTNKIELIGMEFSKKLSVVSDINADDILSAVGKCILFSDKILDEIALEVGMPIENLMILKAYEIVSPGEDVEMVKFDYDALDKMGSKALNLSRFWRIVNSCNNNERINRAIHWYRKALNETDNLDIFSYIWICLETLNPLFLQKYPDAYEISRCEKCNFERKNISTAPLKLFFQNVLNNAKLYSDARRIRQSIVHGFEDIGVIQKKLVEIIDELEVSCRKAIFFLMGLNIDSFSYNIGIGNNEGFTFVTFMKFSNFNTDEENPSYFEPEVSVEIELSENNNELVIKPIVTTNVLNHGCGISGLGWDVYGDPGYPIRKIQIALRNY